MIAALERLRARFPRLAAAIVSGFALWHVCALLLGPAPESRTQAAIYPLFRPYLRLLHLDAGWGFFAPDPHPGVLMSYVLEDADGNEHEIDFTRSLNRSATAFQRYTMLQDYLWIDAQPYATHAARFLCRRHAELAPMRIAFRFRRVQTPTPEAWRDGHRPLDPDFLVVEDHDPVPCER